MIELPPSVLRPYGIIWFRDPALNLHPGGDEVLVRADGEDEDAFAARQAAHAAGVAKAADEAFTAYMKAATEHGDWSALLRAGHQPTIFRVRQIPGSVWDAIDTWRANRLPSDAEYFALLFRAGVIAIEHAPGGLRVELEEHRDENHNRTGIGKVLKASVRDELHAIDKRIIPEVAPLIATQRGGPAGK